MFRSNFQELHYKIQLAKEAIAVSRENTPLINSSNLRAVFNSLSVQAELCGLSELYVTAAFETHAKHMVINEHREEDLTDEEVPLVLVAQLEELLLVFEDYVIARAN